MDEAPKGFIYPRLEDSVTRRQSSIRPVIIDSIEAYEQVRRNLSHLLSEEGSASAAVGLSEALVAGQGQEMNLKNLRAWTYTEAGIRLKDRELMEEGVRVWSELEARASATISYNLASAQLHLWQLAVEQVGLGDAWLEKRSHLHEARRLFTSVAEDEDAETELRLKALTDCGNSFDIVGRYLDALGYYERAQWPVAEVAPQCLSFLELPRFERSDIKSA